MPCSNELWYGDESRLSLERSPGVVAQLLAECVLLRGQLLLYTDQTTIDD